MNNRPAYNETELLAALAAGNEAAFTEIYNHYHAAVYHYLIGFVKAPFIAEDLVHEVFIKIWEIREKLQVKTSFSAYLYRVCHNKALDALKKIASDKMLRQQVTQWLEPGLQNNNDVFSRVEYYEQLLEKAIDTLPPQGKKVFLLCREQGKSYDEAAKELGISRNTVKEHMVNSMRLLRQYLSGIGEFTFVLLLIKKFF